MKNKKIFILILSAIVLIGVFSISGEGRAATCAEVGGICTGVSECAGFKGSCRADSPLDCAEPCCCVVPSAPRGFCPTQIMPECGSEGCSLSDLVTLICNIINFIINCLTIIFAGLMIAIGGFYFLLAAGDPGKIETGKKILMAAIIGTVIVFLAGNLLKAFLSKITRGEIPLCQ